MSLLHSLYTHAFRISLNQRNGNGLPRGVGAVVASKILRRWFSASKPSTGAPVRRPLNTLNSERLLHVGQKIFDLSHYLGARLWQGNFTCQIYYAYSFRFPPGTKGFFYYHQPPALPPLAGEMRFRICDDASQFVYGKDLEVESGKPWNVPLINIVMVGNYKGLRNILLEEGFIDHELVVDIENMKSVGRGAKAKKRGLTLYDIDQPFSIDLSTNRLYLRLSTRSRVRTVVLRLFSIARPGAAGIYSPFAGRIEACFEIDPQKSDTEKRMLRLRVLEILSPVTSNTPPDDYIPSTAIAEPRPGMFLSRKRDNRRLEPWALSLSRKDGHAAIFRDFIAERALEKEKYGV